MAESVSGFLHSCAPLVAALSLLSARPQATLGSGALHLALVWGSLSLLLTFLVVGVGLLLNWFHGFWAFHLVSKASRSTYTPPEKRSSPPTVSIRWSAPHDFPEDFGPLLGLKNLSVDTEGVDGNLVDKMHVKGKLKLRAGKHLVQVGKSARLEVEVTDSASKSECNLCVEADRSSSISESKMSCVSVQVPGLRLRDVAGLLEAIWELWWSPDGKSSASAWKASARWLCVMALRLLESVVCIQLSAVEGTAVGDQFLLFFSGGLGPIPFFRVHLPPFVVPRVHSTLAGLLSTQPIVGQRLSGQALPMAAHPGVLESFSAVCSAQFAPVALDGELQLRDGSVPSFGANFQDKVAHLSMSAALKGNLSNECLIVDVESFSVESDSATKRGLRGSGKVRLGLAKSAKAGGATLSDVLFESQKTLLLETPLKVESSLRLDEGSDFPGTLRVSVGDTHPLMLGQASNVILVHRAKLHGESAFTADLPMQRKRDLLQLPTVDLHFDAAVTLEEGSSYVDDGFSKLLFQDTSGSVTGRIWSEDAVSLKAEANVEGKCRLQGKLRDSGLVQVLHEAEKAALCYGPAKRMARRPQAASAAAVPDDVFRASDRNEVGVEAACAVKTGDPIRFGVSARVKSLAKIEIVTGTKGDLAEPLAGAMSSIASVDGQDLVKSGKVMITSLRGTRGDVEFGEVRAQVGSLTMTLPPSAAIRLETHEAMINAEGIGRTHLHATWSGLGRAEVVHAEKQLATVLPELPSEGGVTLTIGDMGRVTMEHDRNYDLLAFGNRLLDDEAIYGHLIVFAMMLNMEEILVKLLDYARVVRNIVRSENVAEPKDIIPAKRMARFIARLLAEIGTDGKFEAPEEPSPLEEAVFHIVSRVNEAEGLDVTKMTRVLWDSLPKEASDFVKSYMAEVDFLIKWIDTVLKPTEAYAGAEVAMSSALKEEPRPAIRYCRELQMVAPTATRLYEAVWHPEQMPKDLEMQVCDLAPYLTSLQVDYLLSHGNISEETRRRLQIVLGIKQRVEKVGGGYGGPAFMPQGMAVGFFLATAIRGSFATGEPGRVTINKNKSAAAGVAGQPGGVIALQQLLEEQKTVAAEIQKLQSYQQELLDETTRLLAGKHVTPGTLGKKLASPAPQPVKEGNWVCMLDFLSPGDHKGVKSTLRSNIDLAVKLEKQIERRRTHGSPQAMWHGVPAVDFDFGTSLLGPLEVATLLQSGLAAVPQGRQVQQNQRMLLELIVSQPALFQRGVFYELSNNGSARVLSNHLLALLDLKQDAVRPEMRLDVADLLTTALGIELPRRADFMAGGRHASHSYILFLHRAATKILEECMPYVALKQWVQQVEVHDAPPSPMATKRLASSEAVVAAAKQAIEEADAVGSEWLKLRGCPWQRHSTNGGSTGGGAEEQKLRTTATERYQVAFERCGEALKAHRDCLQMDWFKSFWGRNYDSLTVVSVLRNVQQDIDNTRAWVHAQVGACSKGPEYKGVSMVSDDFWSTERRAEDCLLDMLLEVLFYEPAVRQSYRSDPLMQLALEAPAGKYNFTVVSAMGVITEGAAGTEMKETYERLSEVRGVEVVRANTATLHSVDFNAEQIQKAVMEHVKTPWGWVGYSQGCANAFRAEALMLQGTPGQQKLLESFRCRQLLFSAANGSAHATCGDWKLLRALIDGERFLKKLQASMSATTQLLGLNLLHHFLCSRVGSAFFGSVQSLTHEGARKMWRDGQHCRGVPSTSMIGVAEQHTLPECLDMLWHTLNAQMEYSNEQDTQVAQEEAVAHPICVDNANRRELEKTDMRSAVQRTHHWSPLRQEVLFLQTERDKDKAVFDTPKDRHIFPWLEVNARFGVIEVI